MWKFTLLLIFKNYAEKFLYLYWIKNKKTNPTIMDLTNYIRSHQHCLDNVHISPLSGSEPSWDTKKWIPNQKNNNCYVYALDDLEMSAEKRTHKPTPESNSIHNRISNHEEVEYTCSNLSEGLYNQIPSIYPTLFECQCQPGYKKIYFAVSDDQPNDFHFWRQDNDGSWSHKVGSNQPQKEDAIGNVIVNPDTSSRNFSSHNYTNACGFYCVPLGATGW
jgi:hypothetical protein